jgi:PAS domain S-box-containing protein
MSDAKCRKKHDASGIPVHPENLRQPEHPSSDRTQQLEALRWISAEITRELDLTRLLGIIHRRAASLLGVKAGFLTLYDETTQSLKIQSWAGHGEWVDNLKFIIGKGISGTVASQRRGMVVNDYRTSAYAMPMILDNTSVTSVIAEPLIYRDRLVGVVTIDNQGAEDRSFTEEDSSILTLFAVQAAIAIENARLFEAVQRELGERKRAEAQLLESEQRFRTLAKAAFEGIAVTTDGMFLDVNDQLAGMVGYDCSELIGRPVEMVIAPESRELVRNAQQMRRVEPYEYLMLRKDGSTFQAEVRARYAAIEDKEVRIAAIRDITERKLAEEERANLQAQLYQSQKMDSVGQLAGGMAHDFNNMLTAILGNVQMAMMHSSPSGPIHSNLSAIEQSVLRSADLIRQLLGFARKQTIAPKVLNLNKTVESMLNMLRRLIGEAINFAWLPDAELRPVRIDPSQIDQLLVNLCVNARDAIPEVGKITIETGNAVFDEAYCAVHQGYIRGEYSMLAVSDNGCGMDKSILDHIFEPFFTTKEMGSGTGLGLATVYGIVRQNKGFINVYSEPDKGSTFKIYLPSYAGHHVEPVVKRVVKTQKGCGETVLLVEDNEVILDMTRQMLEGLNYRVLTASSPSRALQHVKTYGAEIKLVITDVVMPEMNGKELSKQINDISPGLKCLFHSGYTANVIAHQGVLDPGVHFLQKPFSIKALSIKVREALGQSVEE